MRGHAGEGGVLWYEVSLFICLDTFPLVLPIAAGRVHITSQGWLVALLVLPAAGIVWVTTGTPWTPIS